jgi:predicted dithiol-disulfide oxidoreductase (DUF899 family)
LRGKSSTDTNVALGVSLDDCMVDIVEVGFDLDGVVNHTYSTYARGVAPFFGVYHWLARAPKGRNETGVWWRRHDAYNMR